MNIEVVPIGELHIDGFRAGLDSVARERMYLAQVEAPSMESVRAFVMNSIAMDAAHFVATHGSSVVGWCDILPAWAPAVRHRGTVGMGVIANYRGRGIGRQLLAACLDKAKRNGITRVQLEVRSDNAAAIHLYRSFGFIQEAILRHAMRLDQKYYEAVQMSLIHEQEV